MQIYLSSAYSRRTEMQKYSLDLQKRGHTIVSSWLDEKYALDVTLDQLPRGTAQDIALTDLNELDLCECLIFFSEPSDQQPPRGGRHVEFGYGLKAMKKIVVVGRAENLFHHLPPRIVAVVPSWEGALEWLKRETLLQKEPELWGV